MTTENMTMTTAELQSFIEDAIHHLHFDGRPASLYEPAKYMMHLGGKRMRPLLTLMANDLFDGNIDAAIKPALAMEVFHNFTLMHDDVMDNASIRRGKETVHKKWNTTTAILSGDVMLVLAYELLCQAENDKLLPLLHLFNDTAKKVCEGQQMDMEFQQQSDITTSHYLEMIGLKTASLIAACLKTGAILAGALYTDADALYDCGYALGMSFQIQDDILDSYGDTATFGKTIGGDIAENKRTFLLLKAMEEANPDQKQKLEALLNDTRLPQQQKITEVLSLYQTLNIKHAAEIERDWYYNSAFEILDRIDAPEEKKEPLKELAASLLRRER